MVVAVGGAGDLDAWLAPFLKVLGRKTRRTWAPLWPVLAHEAGRLVGGPNAYLVIDDTALPKKGELSVGVARQYCGQLRKKANC